MKKILYTNFTPALLKAFKAANHIYCSVSDDGKIYACNGYFAVCLRPDEYDAFVRPAAQCDPGNYVINENGERETSTFDIIGIMRKASDDNANAAPLYKAPFTHTTQEGRKKSVITCYYNADADFAALFNADYTAILDETATLKATSALSGAVHYNDADEIDAFILPIKLKGNEIGNAIRAYFSAINTNKTSDGNADADELQNLRRQLKTAQENENTAAQIVNELKTQLADTQSKLNAKAAANKALATENDALRAQLAAQPTPDETTTPDARTAAEKLAAYYAQFDGVKVTIKGAQTLQPVVWLDGNTQPHADKIKTDGGKWSTKRGAYYFRVA